MLGETRSTRCGVLNSSLTQPALAVTDFHGGFIDTFIPGFAPVALPGSLRIQISPWNSHLSAFKSLEDKSS